MGFRFRRSVKIAPGLRLNFGKRGVSMSAGPPGATVNVSSRGTRLTTSIPGTGISYSEKLTASTEPAPAATGDEIPKSTAVWLIGMALGFFAMLTQDRTLMMAGWVVSFVSMMLVLRGASIIVRLGGAFLFACALLVVAITYGA